jgi:ABC-2 type transport system ATP-binding protein
VNGLDPEGIVWVRNLLRSLAAEGRTVFVSSHLMSEMALTADHLLVIGRGKIITSGPTATVIAQATQATVRVVSPQAAQIASLLQGPEVTVSSDEAGVLTVIGATTVQVGELAAANNLVLHELTPVSGSLEEAYMSLTQDSVEYHSSEVPAELTQEVAR